MIHKAGKNLKSRVLPEKLTVAQLIPTSHANLKFITVLIQTATGTFPQLEKSILDCNKQKVAKVNQLSLIYIPKF